MNLGTLIIWNKVREVRYNENKQIIESLDKERSEHLDYLLDNLIKLEEKHSASNDKASELHQDWSLIRGKFKEDYTKAKENSTSSQATLNSIKEQQMNLTMQKLSKFLKPLLKLKKTSSHGNTWPTAGKQKLMQNRSE